MTNLLKYLFWRIRFSLFFSVRIIFFVGFWHLKLFFRRNLVIVVLLWIMFKPDIMSTTDEYGLFFKNIVILLKSVIFLIFLIFFLNLDFSFLEGLDISLILKKAFILDLRGDNMAGIKINRCMVFRRFIYFVWHLRYQEKF